MVQYQTMTFSTTGGTGTITPVSASTFQSMYGYNYNPSYNTWVDSYNTPYYGDYYQVGQMYQSPSTVPTTPTAVYQAQYSTPAATPIAKGLHSTINKVADLGAVGDAKTVQMETNRFRTLTRTGTDTYSWVDTDKNGNVIASGASRSDGVVLTNHITFQPSSTPAKALPSSPVVLVDAGGYGSHSTADIPSPGDNIGFNVSATRYVVIRRLDDGSYWYTEKDQTTGKIIEDRELVPGPSVTAPTTPPSATPASIAPVVQLTPSPSPVSSTAVQTSPGGSQSSSPAPSEQSITVKNKPLIVFGERSSIDEPLMIQSAVPGGQGDEKEGEGEGDISAEEPNEDTHWYSPIIDALMPDTKKKDPVVPRVERGVVGGGVEDPVSSSTETLSPPEAPPTPTAPSSDFTKKSDTVTEREELPPEVQPETASTTDQTATSDNPVDDLPRTEDDKRRVVLDFLVDHQQDLGMTDAETVAVATHFYPWAPKMYQEGYDLSTLGKISVWYDGLVNGDADAFNQLGSVHVSLPAGQTTFGGFLDLTPEQQQSAIIDFNKKLAENDIPSEAVVLFNSGIYAKLGQDDSGDTTRDWMKHDGILKALQKDTVWNTKNGISDFLHSSEGQAILGGGALIAGIGIGFLAAGPVGAAAGAKFGAGTGALVTAGAQMTALSGINVLPYSLTELPTAWQDTDFKINARLERANTLGKSVDTEADQLFRNYKDAVSAYNYNTNTEDKDQNLALKASAENAGQEYKEYINKNAFALEGVGKLDNHVTQYDTQQMNQNAVSNRYKVDGTYENPKIKATKVEFSNMREGWKVDFQGKVYEGKGTENSDYFKKPVSGAITLISPDGIRYSSETVRLFADGNDPVVDIGSLIDKATSYGAKGTPKATSGKTTIYVPEGIKFTHGGQTYIPGSGGASYDIERTQGTPLRITFESVDGTKKPLTEYLGFPESGWNAYSVPPDLKGVVGGSVQGLQTHLSEGQKLYWKDLDITKYIDQETGLVVMPEPGYYNLSVVNADGKKETKNVYVGAGSIVDIGYEYIYKEPFVPYSSQKKSSGGSSYSSGGGGGGSSRSSGGSGYTQRPPEQTLIKYGETCRDSDIWQDDIKVYPEIDVEYSIDPGYHSIRVEKVGKKPWVKTVYCTSGDTLTVSPALEDIAVVTPPVEEEDTQTEFPKRVFINSNPSGGKVLVNGAVSGQWTPCYLDLPMGYYTFTIDKTGYDPYDIKCYVGDVIAWNQQAIDLASSKGLI